MAYSGSVLRVVPRAMQTPGACMMWSRSTRLHCTYCQTCVVLHNPAQALHMSETLPVEIETGSVSDTYNSPGVSRMRRSTYHEAEVASLLKEGRYHASPRNLYPRRSSEAETTTSAAISSNVHDFDSKSTFDSPSVAAKMWRDQHSTPPSSGGPPDLGDEYIHRRTTNRRVPFSLPAKPHYMIPKLDVQTHRSASMDALTAHLSDAHLSSPDLNTAQHQGGPAIPRSWTQNVFQQVSFNPKSQHTHNIRLALEQCQKLRERTNGVPKAATELVEQLETAAHLADTLNQKLHNVAHAQLNERMKGERVPVGPYETKSARQHDAELSMLLKYSDDLVRSLTDSILFILRDQRKPKRSSTSMSFAHTSPRQCISPPHATHRAATFQLSDQNFALKQLLRSSRQYASEKRNNGTSPHASLHNASQAIHSNSFMDSPHSPISRFGSFWTDGASSAKSKSLHDISSFTPRHRRFNEHRED